VVIKPSTIPHLSLRTLAKGAKQLVVHEAFDTIYNSFLYVFSLTPITNIGVLSLAGADMIHFLAPPLICF